ncbi:glycosyltransferase [Antrihabitans sp. YC2-6]|uniref:glycosyltransferase n=1 Tax=Antrihabitans sp. YC2-6 TaxID=2799498 RepID=UPI0018F32731|nr:nucleotide disphospho-sugar-binding domain-containing protein [Antrihabitans sp. YC2-6]MBJ8348324.1 glycosyltransferase [Antrihabitans sp. YC2-6]
MSRFMFVVPPLAAHVHPTSAVGLELLQRGHDVAWVGHQDQIASMLPAGVDIIDVGEDSPHPAGFSNWAESLEVRRMEMRGVVAFRFLWEEFLVPLAASMVPGIEKAVSNFAPDVLAVDQHTVGGAVVARQHDLPWATMAIMSAELVDPLPGKLQDWVRQQLDGLWRQFGDGGVGVPLTADLRFSDRLVVAFTSEALVGSVDRFPDFYKFVGPSIAPRTGEFPWEWLDPNREHVLLSLGTVSGPIGERFLDTAIEAVAELGDRLQLIVVAPPRTIQSNASHVLVRNWVPYLELLPHLDAIVCHAGHTTTCEALAHGVPLVMAPIRDDQPVVAWQVENAGAGLRVKFGRVRPPEVRDALLRVLDDASFREAARRIKESFTAAGGAAAAADHLERML